jgi:hypothetical protein
MGDLIIPWEQPRGAVHSLARLAELSSQPCNILCVSDRTLYILANYAALDITFRSRFSADETDHGYQCVSRDDGLLWDLYQDIIRNFQLEVVDMTCDIESGLTAIAEAIAGLDFPSGGGCGYAPSSGGSQVLPCIGDIPNDELLPPEGMGPFDPEGDPPGGFETWEEYYTYKCQAAEFIWNLERKHMVNLRNFEGISLAASIVGPIVAGLAGVLPAMFTPAGFVVFVASVVAIGVVAGASWFYMDEMISHWDDNHDDIICALYNSGTSAQATSALANALEDAIQAIISWGALGGISGQIKELLGVAFAELAGNGIVEPLFKTVVAASAYEADCSECQEPSAADLFETRVDQPYNQLLIGDSIEAEADNETEGYRGKSAIQEVILIFTPDGNANTWEWSMVVGMPYYPGETFDATVILQEWAGSGPWEEVDRWEFTGLDTDVWETIDATVLETPLVFGRSYKLFMTAGTINQWYFYHAIQGWTLS